MSKPWTTYLGCGLGLILLTACGRDEQTPEPPSYRVEVPANFPPLHYTFADNPVTKEGFELGRMLFYDPRLSSDSTVSCGTCHRQAFAFADHTHDLSHGVSGQLGNRNTPGLANLSWQREFFWDGGANHIEVSPLNALMSPVEMDETLENVIRKLNRSTTYQQQFKGVFGKEPIDSQMLLRALAQFTGSLVSANSHYDQYRRGVTGVVLRPNEKAGLALFEANCVGCHATDLFTDQSYRNNGLDVFFRDKGREIITGDSLDRGKFRVPSLRNVALTAPYMHDGRFKSLEAVLKHYASGVKNSATLDPLLRQGVTPGISLTDEEQSELIGFLNTLTDSEFCTTAKFKDPF